MMDFGLIMVKVMGEYIYIYMIYLVTCLESYIAEL